MIRSILLILVAASLNSAHFVLNWPPTAGFIDDDEPNAPCGGATPVFNDSIPEIQVDRFAIAIFSSHPAGTWSFLASTKTDEPYDFQQFAAVNSTGAGDFCLTEFTLPGDYAGKQGIIQVIDGSVDGTLYQRAPVKFVTGSNSTDGSACSNNTGFSAQFASSSPSTATPSATPTSTGAAAAMATGVGSVLGLGLLAAGFAL